MSWKELLGKVGLLDSAFLSLSAISSPTCLRMVAVLGPLSCCTDSLFMPTSRHLLRRQPLHWFLWVLSTLQRDPVLCWFLQGYSLPLLIVLLKNPAHPSQAKIP